MLLCVFLFAVEYYDDKKDPENYVYIGVDVKGLKTTLFGSNADNADITFERTERYVKFFWHCNLMQLSSGSDDLSTA